MDGDQTKHALQQAFKKAEMPLGKKPAAIATYNRLLDKQGEDEALRVALEEAGISDDKSGPAMKLFVEIKRSSEERNEARKIERTRAHEEARARLVRRLKLSVFVFIAAIIILVGGRSVIMSHGAPSGPDETAQPTVVGPGIYSAPPPAPDSTFQTADP